MNQERFEAQVLDAWMTTRIPFTRPNLLFLTGAPRRKLDKWLDDMVRESVLDVDSDDDGEMIWSVCGAARSASGPERVEDVARLRGLSREVRGEGASASTALVARGSRGAASLLSRVERRRGNGDKSLVLSGALSFFFGPLGWLYAGPLREALPAAGLYLLAFALLRIVPLLFYFIAPFMGLLMIASAGIGVLYASQHNRAGRPIAMLGDDDDETPRLPGRR